MTQALSDFDYVRHVLRQTTAVVLEHDKDYLIRTRLAEVAETEGFDSVEELIHQMRGKPAPPQLQSKIIDALTTHESSFFRDHHPFVALREHILPELIERRRDARELRIWSAACSTGQEAYSIAMLIREYFPALAGWKITLLGTDISEGALARARNAVYSQHEVNRGLPAPLLVKYCEQHPADMWRISDELREMAEFRSFNLIQPWPQLPAFDLIFLRNVLIYFDVEAKRRVLASAADAMAGDGYLALGSAETPLMITDKFTPVSFGRAILYRKAAG